MQQMLTRLKTQFTGAYADENPEVMGCILDTELLRKKKEYKWNKQHSSWSQACTLEPFGDGLQFLDFSTILIIKLTDNHDRHLI